MAFAICAEIAREIEHATIGADANRKLRARGARRVTSVAECQRDVRCNLHFTVKRNALDFVHRVAHIGRVEEALCGRKLRRGARNFARHERATPRCAAAGTLVKTCALQLGTRAKHAAEEFMRRGRCVDFPAKTETWQHCQSTAVIDVCVRDDDGVNERKVDFGRDRVSRFVGGRTLEHAKVDDDARFRRTNKCATACHFAGGAVKFKCCADDARSFRAVCFGTTHRAPPACAGNAAKSKISSSGDHHSPSRAKGVRRWKVRMSASHSCVRGLLA